MIGVIAYVFFLGLFLGMAIGLNYLLKAVKLI